MSQSQRDAIKSRAKTDRYFLARGILGYRDVNPYTHGPLFRFIQDRTKKRRMGLAPRGHLKSTIWTITDSVGLALEDPDECRILIVNEIEDNSVGFLSEIKGHFENNDLLRELFPEVLPDRTSGPGSRWSAAKACLKRTTSYKEWTWNAIGVGGAVTSRHFNHIKADDLIGFQARESPASMKFAITYAKSLEPLLVDMDNDFIDFIGTRWAIFDLYREMLNAYGEDMAYFSREDIEEVPELPEKVLRDAGFKFDDPKEIIGTRQPIFPKKFSLKRLHRLSIIDPVLYYAQYKNNPIADGIKDFNLDLIKLFDFDEQGNIVYRDSKGRLQRWAREALDIIMTCDPNSGSLTAPDLPAIVVSAQSPREQIFVFESWAKRVQPDAFVDQMYDMWQRWQPRAMGIEQAAQQQSLFYFKKKAKELRVYINVVPLKPKNRDKQVRIRKALQPLVNLGQVYLRKTQESLRQQFQFHPDLSNDDEIDALSYGPELWRTPQTAKEKEEDEDAVKKVMDHRRVLTGY